MPTIDPKDLKIITGYQELCKDDAAVTTRATFRLSELEYLIKEIRKNLIKENEKRVKDKRPELITKDGKIDLAEEYKCHTVTITFVRERITADKKLKTNFSRINSRQLLLENSIKKNEGEYYTQIIPIISGCIAHLDDNFHNKHFEYLFNDSGKIPFIHPGGEGSGLIPPPPPGGEDFK